MRLEPAFDRSDVWAVGVIVAEALAGRHPYLHGLTVVPDDLESRLRSPLDLPTAVPDDLRSVLLAATEYPAYRRPAAEALLAMLMEEKP